MKSRYSYSMLCCSKSRATASPSGRSARNSPDSAVVPTPSLCTPSFSSVRWNVGNIAKMPIEPVSVAGTRDDAVGVHGDVVAARCRQAAHRGHDRLAGLAQGRHLAADHLAREHAAARAVDAQHDGLDRFVLARLAQLPGQRVGADHARRLLAGQDLARCDDDRDAVWSGYAAERLLRADVGEIRVVVDADEDAAVVVLAGDLGEPLLDREAALERGDEPGIERHLREAAVGAAQALDGVVGIGLQRPPARMPRALATSSL